MERRGGARGHLKPDAGRTGAPAPRSRHLATPAHRPPVLPTLPTACAHGGAHARAAVARQAPTAPKPKEKSAFEKKLEERERRGGGGGRKAELRQQMAARVPTEGRG